MSKEEVGLHPLVKQMNSLGCKSMQKVSMALQVYFDLCEAKGMWDTNYGYNSKLDLIYITGKWNKNVSITEVVVPMSASASVSPSSLLELETELLPGELKKIALAFVAGDSSICYYHTQCGLHPPDSPETVRKRRLQEERRQCRGVEVVQKARELLSNIIGSVPEQEDQ